MSYASEFAAALNEKFPTDQAWDEPFGITEGKLYDRITRVIPEGYPRAGEPRSVHAFVEKSTGKLVKAAGWLKPAKLSTGELQSKFNLSTPEGFAEAIAAADRFGSYLYVR